MISIINIGMSNIKSVERAFVHLGQSVQIIESPNQVQRADCLVFPGVGNFMLASKVLHRDGWSDAIREAVLIKKKNFLGICLGMQLMFELGTEGGGKSKGLELLAGEVLSLRRHNLDIRIPHVGWNNVSFENPGNMYKKISQDSSFYFVHSYEVVSSIHANRGNTSYGVTILASVEKDNIWASQFHPEKSQRVGLQLLQNFCSI